MSFLKKEVTLPKLSVPKLPSRSSGGPKRPRRSSVGAKLPRRSSVGPKLPRRSAGGPKLPRRSPDGTKLPRREASSSRSVKGHRGTGVTGLEISATQLVAAEAALLGNRVAASHIASRAIPAGLVRDGVVLDSAALATELKAFFSEHRLGRRVRVGLATPRTILRVIDLPPLAEEDIPTALQLQAQDRIPMPLDRAVLDHQTVGLIDTPDGQRMRVIVVATERAATDVLLETLRQANLRPVGIDLSIFAAMRAVWNPEPSTGPLLYAQLGDLVNVAIAESGVCHFTRQAPQGLAYVLDQLVQLRDISIDEARALLFSAAGDEDVDADPADVRDVGALLGRVASELGSELRAAAEFYGTQSRAIVSTGVVTGPLAPLRGFVPALAEASGLDLSAGEVHADDAVLDGLDARVAPVAVGLTVEDVPR